MIDEVLRGEAIESEINRFVDRRAKQASAANAEEDLWKASVRRHAAKLREERLRDQLDFHRAQLDAHTRTFTRLLDRHKGALRLVEAELGITTNEGESAV